VGVSKWQGGLDDDVDENRKIASGRWPERNEEESRKEVKTSRGRLDLALDIHLAERHLLCPLEQRASFPREECDAVIAFLE